MWTAKKFITESHIHYRTQWETYRWASQTIEWMRRIYVYVKAMTSGGRFLLYQALLNKTAAFRELHHCRTSHGIAHSSPHCSSTSTNRRQIFHFTVSLRTVRRRDGTNARHQLVLFCSFVLFFFHLPDDLREISVFVVLYDGCLHFHGCPECDGKRDKTLRIHVQYCWFSTSVGEERYQ